MLDAEWSVEEVADVTLVEVTVHNPTAVDRRVRVDDRLDGPTLPPRTDGVPERGWDADGYEGVVPAGDRLRLGYAAPAAPVEPPVSVTDGGRAEDDGDARETAADATEAVRLLGDASPPADALPSLAAADGTRGGDDATGRAAGSEDDGRVDGPDGAVSSAESGESTGDDGTAADDAPSHRSRDDDGTPGDGTRSAGERKEGRDGTDGGGAADASDRPGAASADPTGPEPASEGLPAAVVDWFADVERRVDHAERLTDASVVEAAAVLDERGGLSGVEALPERVADDEAALRAVAERATALADRAAAADVPLPALRRLS